VGQVVKHRSEGYTGVIIGWDLKARVSFLRIMQLKTTEIYVERFNYYFYYFTGFRDMACA